MKHRFTAQVAAAAALVLLAACSDDGGPTTLAQGDDVHFGAGGLGEETLDITAEEGDGTVTGEARFTPTGLAIDFQCADTATDDLVVLGGEVTANASDETPPVGDLLAVVIWEGEPDRVVLWYDEGAGSCEELVDALPSDYADSEHVTPVDAGDDIVTS
jgi:hypothetical protein